MSIEVSPVERSRDLAAFVDVPWRIPDIANHPQWVPPLRMMVRDNLDTKRNPFYHEAARTLFIARRKGVPVGRIAAIENRAHNAFHQDRVGFFGFFETVNDAEVANALLDAAASWLRSRALTSMRGPMHPSTNYDCGVLVDGFDRHPVFLTSWNPPYYDALLRAAGLDVAQNLVGYWIPFDAATQGILARLTPVVARATERVGLTFRDLQPKHFWRDVEKAWDVYNSAWERNWGFVPMSRAEFMHMAKSMQPLLDARFAFLAEVNGQPAGFMLSLLDYNRVLKRVRNGRLFPTGALRLLMGKRRLNTGRGMALGIKPEFRTRSVLPVFLYESVRRALAIGSPGTEASWILEGNDAMRAPIERLGGTVYRRWRIYERALV
jgi:hypothetical protein